MTNIQADAPVTARDHIRAHLRTAESATRAQLVAALSGKVAAQTIDNFIHDGKRSGEIEVERHTYGHHRVKLRANFIDPRRAMRATLLEVKVAIVALMRQKSGPLSIDVIIASLPAGTDESVVRALVKSMAKAGMLLSSLDDGSPCYQLSNAYRASSDTNPYHLLRHVERTEYVSPPAPSSAPTEAPTGPALVATQPPVPLPPPDAAIPSALAAAPEPIVEGMVLFDGGGETFASTVEETVDVPAAIRALADDITAATREATNDGTDSNTLRMMIDCVANAQRLAGLTARGAV